LALAAVIFCVMARCNFKINYQDVTDRWVDSICAMHIVSVLFHFPTE